MRRLVLTATLAACGHTAAPASAPLESRDDTPPPSIPVLVALPADPAAAQETMRGIHAGVAHLAATDGPRLEPIPVDADADVVAALARSGAVAVIGTPAHHVDVPVLSSSRESKRPERFRLSVSDRYRGGAAGVFAAAQGWTTMSTVLPANDPKGLYVMAATSTFERKHGQAGAPIRYATGATQFAAQSQQLVAEAPDVILAPAALPETLLLLQQARQAGVTAPALASPTWDPADLVAAPCPVPIHVPVDFAVDDPGAATFVDEVAAADPDAPPPTADAAFAYDAVLVLARALSRSSTSLEHALLEARYSDLPLATGTFTNFGERREPEGKSLAFVAITNGSTRFVARAP